MTIPTGEALLIQYTPLIAKHTLKFHRRAMGLGCPMDQDDIRQELIIVMQRCAVSYDDSKGSSFMNFLINAWYHEMNRVMRRDQRNRDIGMTLNQTCCSKSDGEELNLLDTIDSGWATPEQNLEALSSLQVALRGLSDEARMLVDILLDSPDSISDQFELQQRGAVERREAGISRRSMTQLNLKFLLTLFEVPTDVARKLSGEIRSSFGAAFDLVR